MKCLYLLFIGLFVLSCKNKHLTNDKVIDLIESSKGIVKKEYDIKGRLNKILLSYGGKEHTMNIKYSNDKIESITNYTGETRYGDCFDFYSDGRIKTFTYYLGEKQGEKDLYRYRRKFSEDQKIIDEEGTPYVGGIEIINKKTNNLDSIILLFSYVPYDSIEAKYSFRNSCFNIIPLKESDLQPFLMEGKLGIPSPGIFYLRIRVKLDKKNYKTYADTISISE